MYNDSILTSIFKDGAFDKAVEGIDAIIHLATPLDLSVAEPAEMIDPAVRGTVGLLNSVIAHGPSVKRVVYVSSAAAVAAISTTPTQRTWDENDWNDMAVQACQEQGRDTPPLLKYCASKVLAERAAWDVFEKHKASSSWELVTIAPPYVFGPFLHFVSSPQTMNGSMQLWYDAVFGGSRTGSQLSSEGYVISNSF